RGGRRRRGGRGRAGRGMCLDDLPRDDLGADHRGTRGRGGGGRRGARRRQAGGHGAGGRADKHLDVVRGQGGQRRRGGPELNRDLLRVGLRARAVEDLRARLHRLRLRRCVRDLAGLVAAGGQRLRDLRGQAARVGVAVVDVDRHLGGGKGGGAGARGARARRLRPGGRRARLRAERVRHQLLYGGNVDDVHILRARVTRHGDVVLRREGQRRERQVLPVQRLHVGGEVEQVEARVGDEVLVSAAEQRVQLRHAAEHALVLELVDHVVDDGLLPPGPPHVGTGERVARADEGE